MPIRHICMPLWGWSVCVLQPCAAGRSLTLLALCCLLIGPRPTTRDRIASGASMWKRTRGSCLTSKCKRLHLGEMTSKVRGEIRLTATLLMMQILFVFLRYFRTIKLRHHAQYSHWEVFLQLQSLIRFFFLTCYIKKSVQLPACTLTRLASKPPCFHSPGVCLRDGFEMNMLWQSTTWVTYPGFKTVI